MAGSLISGMAASVIFRRKPKPAPSILPKGGWLSVLAILGTLAKPLLKAWLLGRLKDFLAAPHHQTAVSRPAPRPLP
jgi:hypothetical protein